MAYRLATAAESANRKTAGGTKPWDVLSSGAVSMGVNRRFLGYRACVVCWLQPLVCAGQEAARSQAHFQASTCSFACSGPSAGRCLTYLALTSDKRGGVFNGRPWRRAAASAIIGLFSRGDLYDRGQKWGPECSGFPKFVDPYVDTCGVTRRQAMWPFFVEYAQPFQRLVLLVAGVLSIATAS